MLKTNTKNRFLSKIIAAVSLVGLILLGITSSLAAQAVSQGYKSDEPLQRGMLVKESDKDHGKVEAVKSSTLKSLKGVVVNRNDSPITLYGEGQTVFVATSGSFEVLVSDENGNIKSGDYISISSLDGIGMKANADQVLVLGRASSSFNSKSETVGSTKTSSGKLVRLGHVMVDIGIINNPLQKQAGQNNIQKLLDNVSSSVAGESVSKTRAWLAFLLFLVSCGLTGVMIYGGARSSLYALGRNPLSRTSIMKGLLQVVLLGMIIFISGMFGVYLLLKL